MLFKCLKGLGLCLVFLWFAPFGLLGLSTAAEAETVAANYNLFYQGFRIGRAEFRGTLSRKAYDISIDLEDAGLASLFASASGTASSKGLVSSKLSPGTYSLDIKANGKHYQTSMAFKGQRLRKLTVLPKPEKKDLKARVPVNRKNIVNVQDPVSALVDVRRSASSSLSKRDCRTSRRIFEGRFLFDLVLRYDKKEKVKSRSGLVKDTVVCKGYLFYHAGHKKDGPLRTKEVATVWLTKSPKGGFTIPFKMEFQLKKGLLAIEALSFR